MIIQKAYAKLNFNLHVLPEKLPNGYHQVRFINLEASLADSITLKNIPTGIKLICSDPQLAVDETNLAYKAARLVMEKYRPRGGIKIDLKKQIPITGGLGGGSADAAAVILGLNEFWNLNLSKKEINKLARDISMDVCYSVVGGPCEVSGISEIVEPLIIPNYKINLIIISPNIKKPSTAWAYRELDKYPVGKNLERLENLILGLKKNDLNLICQNLHNDFEQAIIPYFQEVGRIKKILIENGALNSLMAGSGLSVFGIWENQKSAASAFTKLEKIYPQTYFCQTI